VADWTMRIPQLSAPRSRVTTGKWRKDYEPSAVWAGNMVYSDSPVPIEIEVDSDGKGVLRSADGWFPIMHSTASGKAMEFEVDSTKSRPPIWIAKS
jgi:hypothetical protein